MRTNVIDHNEHFKQLAAGGALDGNPLMAEYRLLFDEYCLLRHQNMMLEKEMKNLRTQLSDMDRSLYLATRIDPMTGLANRRDIMEKMERELSRSERHGRTFSLLVVDLDNFKQLNEKYGYNDGDDVLVEVARVLMGCVRNEDVCARWGGEEFLFLLAETNGDGALILARKILESLAMTEFKAARPVIRITASIGVCEHRTGTSVYDCLSRADQALRRAKQAGKNRIEVG
jgi:diguanylate cyclase (GGDEF)-like protein